MGENSEKLSRLLLDFLKTEKKFKEAIEKTKERKNTDLYEFFRDSSIQRFEFTTEIFWKLLKEFLLVYEGIECRSPKSCIRELFKTGHVTEDEAKELLKMIDSRNLTVHTYHEATAEEIFSRLENYCNLMTQVVERIERRKFQE